MVKFLKVELIFIRQQKQALERMERELESLLASHDTVAIDADDDVPSNQSAS